MLITSMDKTVNSSKTNYEYRTFPFSVVSVLRRSPVEDKRATGFCGHWRLGMHFSSLTHRLRLVRG